MNGQTFTMKSVAYPKRGSSTLPGVPSVASAPNLTSSLPKVEIPVYTGVPKSDSDMPELVPSDDEFDDMPCMRKRGNKKVHKNTDPTIKRKQAKAQYKLDMEDNGKNPYDVYRSLKGVDKGMKVVRSKLKLLEGAGYEQKVSGLDRIIQKTRDCSREVARNLKQSTIFPDTHPQMRNFKKVAISIDDYATQAEIDEYLRVQRNWKQYEDELSKTSAWFRGDTDETARFQGIWDAFDRVASTARKAEDLIDTLQTGIKSVQNWYNSLTTQKMFSFGMDILSIAFMIGGAVQLREKWSWGRFICLSASLGIFLLRHPTLLTGPASWIMKKLVKVQDWLTQEKDSQMRRQFKSVSPAISDPDYYKVYRETCLPKTTSQLPNKASTREYVSPDDLEPTGLVLEAKHQGDFDASSILNTLATALAGAATLVVVGKGDKSIVKTALTGFSHFPSAAKGMQDFFSIGLKWTEAIVNRLRDWMGYKTAVHWVKTGLPGIDAWLKRAREFIWDYQHGKKRVCQETADELTNIIGTAADLIATTQQPMTSVAASACGVLIPDLRRIMDAMSGFVRFNGARPSPLCILVMGSSGVGKSAAVYAIMHELLARVLPFDQLEHYRKNPNGFIYARQFEHKFWDGYNSQFACVFDDLGQAKDAAGTPDSEFMDLIRCVSIFENVLHKAAIADKGNTRFASRVILCTSNFDKFEPDSINLPEAVHRRFDVSHRLVPRLVYCRPGTTDTLSSRRLKTMDFTTDAWEFHPIALPDCKPLTDTSPLSWDQYIQVLVDAYNEKARNSETLAAGHSLILNKALVERYRKEEKELPEDLSLCKAAEYALKEKTIASERMEKAGAWKVIRRKIPTPPKPLPPIPQKGKAPASDQELDIKEAVADSLAEAKPQIGSLTDVVQWVTRREWQKQVGGLAHEIEQYNLNISNADKSRLCYHVHEAFSAECAKYNINMSFIADSSLAREVDEWWRKTTPERAPTTWIGKLWNGIRGGQHSMLLCRVRDACATYRELNPGFSYADPLQARCQQVDNYLKKVTQSVLAWTDKFNIFRILKTSMPFIVAAATAFGLWYSWGKVFAQPPPAGSQALGVSGEDLKHPKKNRAARRRAAKGGNLRGEAPARPVSHQSALKMDDELKIVQVQIDASAVDIGTSICRTNLYELQLPRVGDKVLTKAGSVLFVQGRIALIPIHYVTQIKEFLETRDYDGSEEGKLVSVYDRAIRFPFKVSDLAGCYATSDLQNNELALVHFSNKNIPEMRNIVQYFMPLEYADKQKDRKGYLVLSRDEKPIIFVADRYQFLHNCSIRDSDGEYVEADCLIKYPIPTMAGDCGVPFIEMDPTTRNRKILGIHTAGDAKSYGLAGFCPFEYLTESLTLFPPELLPFVKRDVTNDNLPTAVPQGGDVGLPGKLLIRQDRPVSAPNRTAIIPSVLHNTYFECKKAPAALRIVEFNGVKIDPMFEGLKGYTREPPMVPEAWVNMAIDKQHAYIVKAALAVNPNPIKRLLTEIEMVCGIPGTTFGPIDRGSSSGWPRSLDAPAHAPGKKFIFGDKEWTLDTPEAKALFKKLKELIAMMEQGIRPEFVYTDHLKDELRKILRTLMGKTRVFSACPLELLLLFRQYFGAWILMMQTGKGQNGCAAGVNTHGEDWDLLARQLAMFKKFLAGDFEGFDQSLMALFFKRMVADINRWYGDSPANQKVREMLFLEITNSKHIRAGDKDGWLYWWHSSMPSGNPITALINSWYECSVERLIYFMGGLRSNMDNEFKTRLWDNFDEHCFQIALGDDHVVATSDIVHPWFNMRTLEELLPRVGMRYTNPDKTPVDKESLPFEKVTFLKRYFRYDGTLRRYLGALDLDTILETACWTKRGSCAETITRSNVQVVLSELALHSRETWDEWFPKIAAAVQDKLGDFLVADYRVEQAKTLNTPFVL
jgi:hypothetical protein